MTDGLNTSGGVDVTSQGNTSVGGDVGGRDIVKSSTTINNYGTGPNGEAIHNSLPNQPYFFGRAAELARIADALDPEAQGWGVLISGPGGIGKTALSIRAAHLAPEKTYPIKIFLSAKVRELTPQGVTDLRDFLLLNYMTLLTELARELGDEAIAKTDPDLRAGEVRRLLANKRVLLVIDNLETFDEAERVRVFQFLGHLPRSCKAVVTSRRWKDVRAESIRLDQLDRFEALQLISKLAERNRYLAKATETERIEIYEMTRGNPLLIEWVAGQLGNPNSKCRTVIDACGFMENAPKDNDPLEFVFGDLLDTFTEHETAVLAALTYFTLPAEVRSIADVAKIPAQQAETALEDLAVRSVLVVNETAAYLLPSVVATFLQKSRPEIIARTGNSLIDRAYALAVQNGHEQYARFSFLEKEWPTLLAAMPLLIEGDNTRLQRVCDALRLFLEFSGHWDEWQFLEERAERRALDVDDLRNAAWRAFQSGWVYYLRGQARDVLICAARALRRWEKISLASSERAYAIRLRGIGHQLEGNYAEAIEAYKESLSLLRSVHSESSGVATILNDLADVERLAGDYQSAEHDYYQALSIAERNKLHSDAVTYQTNLVVLALDSERWSDAENAATVALRESERFDRQVLIAANLMYLAKACARQGRKAEGLPYAQRAVAIFTKLRSPDLAAAQAALKECEE